MAPVESTTSSNTITKADLEKRIDAISTRLSDKVRALALGVLALTWTIFSADKDSVKQMGIAHHRMLLTAAGLAVLCLLCDLVNSVGNFAESERLHSAMEKRKAAEGQFDYGSVLYRSQYWTFVSKIVLAVGACVVILVVLGMSVGL